MVEGLLRTRLGSGPMIQMALGLLLDYDLRELSGIGRRDGGRGGVVGSYNSILGLEPIRTWEYRAYRWRMGGI